MSSFKRQTRVPPVLWVAAGAALWGTDTVLRRPLTGVMEPTQIVFYEHLILAASILPFLLSNRAYLGKIRGKVWGCLIGTALIGSALSTVLFTAALRSGNPTTAVLLQKTQPLFAIFLANRILKERWPARFGLLSVMAVFGAYLVAFGDHNLLEPAYSIQLGPAVLALMAAAGWAAATVWGRIATAEVSIELITSLRIALALPALFVAALIQRQTALPPFSRTATLVWMALIPGLAALMLYYRGLRETPASQATIGELAFPVTASVLNWWVLGVDVAPLQIAGFVVVWAAILMLSRRWKLAVQF